MNTKFSARIVASALVALTPVAAWAQLVIQDNFTGAILHLQLVGVQWRLPDRGQ